MAVQTLLKPSDANAKLVDTLCTSLRRRQIVGSRSVALATATLVHTLVRSVKYSTLDELLELLKYVGRLLAEANPKELSSGNIVRRVLRLFREEYRAAAAVAQVSQPETPLSGPETPGLHAPSNHYLSSDLEFSSLPASSSASVTAPPSNPYLPLPKQPSLSNFVAMRHTRAQLERSGSSLAEMSMTTSSMFQPTTREESSGAGAARDGESSPRNVSRRGSEDFMKQSGKLKPVLIQAVEEVIGELETTHEDVAKGAREHVHHSEVILTLGHSKTVESFLKQAYRDRKFTVVVAESSPTYVGHSMASALATASIPTILIPDSSIHALMPRITKVIIGAHSVLANGGLFALSGTLALCLAAQAHSRPVVVTTGQFKFAPVWNLFHDYGAVDFKSPGDVMGFKGDGGGGGMDGVEGVDPYYEYIRPDLVNLFVTNEGDHSPSYIYRIMKEAYDDEDLEL